ncbi:MAG: VOC family protein [Chloroflexota bacterium]
MSDLFVPSVGAVFSADIAVPEHERELRFYSRVLTTGATPLWRAEDLMNNAGMPIIGLGARSEEYADLPLQWMPHIQVADVAESVQRAVDLRGSVLMHATDDDGNSQWAVLLDPNGAAFGIIPVIPAEMVANYQGDGAPDAAVGRIAWIDLTVPEAAATRDFYQQVVGWSAQKIEMEDNGERYADYGMFDAAGRRVAGIQHARGAHGHLPPVWMMYLSVGDLAESVRRAEAEGGKVISEFREDGKYVYVGIEDPVGVCFALVQG